MHFSVDAVTLVCSCLAGEGLPVAAPVVTLKGPIAPFIPPSLCYPLVRSCCFASIANVASALTGRFCCFHFLVQRQTRDRLTPSASGLYLVPHPAFTG